MEEHTQRNDVEQQFHALAQVAVVASNPGYAPTFLCPRSTLST